MSEEADQILDEIEKKLDGQGGQEGDETFSDEELKAQASAEGDGEGGDEPKKEGHISYEDWVAMGRDPKKYRGEEAFEAHGKTLSELKEQKQMLQAVVESMNEWKANQKAIENQRVENARKEALAELEKAREDEDIAAVEAAKDRLYDLDKAEAPVETSQGLNPAIIKFASSHPIIDKDSAQFDQDFYDDMAMHQGTILDKMTGRDPDRMAALTPRQIERSMEIAYNQTRELYPEKFRSKRNSRQISTPATPQKRQSATVDPVSKLKGYGRNSMNQKDQDPATDIYNLLKKKNPEAAETFLKNITAGMQ